MYDVYIVKHACTIKIAEIMAQNNGEKYKTFHRYVCISQCGFKTNNIVFYIIYG